MIKIVVSEEDFHIEKELRQLHNSGEVGAIASFIGLVRDMTDTLLESLYLECYPAMANKALEDIAHSAREKWQIGNIVIHHRIGALTPKEQIVLIIATSKHREDAFNACWYMMDYLKTDAPFWKKEYTSDGEFWVDAHTKDTQAKLRWQ